MLVALHKMEIILVQHFLLQYMVYWDPSKGQGIADPVINTTHYCFHVYNILSILNVLLIYINIENFFSKMNVEGAQSEKSL